MNRKRFLSSASALIPVMGAGISPLAPRAAAMTAMSEGQANSTNIQQPDTQDAQETAYFKILKHLPYLKEHLGWQMALIEHSMYMLIDEDRGDPVVGERTLPWCAPDASVYVERMRRNLAALEAIPALRLTYDF